MKWYIGQKIVAIRDHPQKLFTKGQVFTIRAIRTSSCICKNTILDIGMSITNSHEKCILCKTVMTKSDPTSWFGDHWFTPIEEKSQELSNISVEQLLEELSQTIGEPLLN